MEIEGSVALVTGASRGIGRAFARALLSRGARRWCDVKARLRTCGRVDGAHGGAAGCA